MDENQLAPITTEILKIIALRINDEPPMGPFAIADLVREYAREQGLNEKTVDNIYNKTLGFADSLIDQLPTFVDDQIVKHGSYL